MNVSLELVEDVEVGLVAVVADKHVLVALGGSLQRQGHVVERPHVVKRDETGRCTQGDLPRIGDHPRKGPPFGGG